MFKKFFVSLILFMSVNVWAFTPIQVKSSFISQIPTLHAHPITSDSYSSIVSYLKWDSFNQNILTQYDGNSSPYLIGNDKISITPTGESFGQCVAFIKGVSNALRTEYWEEGNPINVMTPKYSVIATFDAFGNYYGHVGILISVTDGGIYILDQNYNNLQYPGAIALHFIPWNATSSTLPQASAVNYRVVEQ